MIGLIGLSIVIIFLFCVSTGPMITTISTMFLTSASGIFYFIGCIIVFILSVRILSCKALLNIIFLFIF